MANKMALGLVIGGAVSSTVGAAFKDVESRVKKLTEQGKKARVLQSTIGETMRLRDEWVKAHAAGDRGATALGKRLEKNLGVLRQEGVEVSRLAKEYDRLGPSSSRTSTAAPIRISAPALSTTLPSTWNLFHQKCRLQFYHHPAPVHIL